MERRFDDDQVAEILRRAADLQSEAGSGSDRGATLADLKRIGEEVGFDPALIERAAQDLVRRADELQAEHSGSATQLEQTVPNVVDDEAWEDIVAELRRISGRSGETVTRGLTREWLGGSDVANITLSVRQSAGGTRLRLLLDLGSLRVFTFAIGLPLGFLAAVMTAAVTHRAGLETALALLTGLVAGSAVLLGLRFAVAKGMRSTRRRVAQSFRRIIERAAMEPEPLPDVRLLGEQPDSSHQTQPNRL